MYRDAQMVIVAFTKRGGNMTQGELVVVALVGADLEAVRAVCVAQGWPAPVVILPRHRWAVDAAIRLGCEAAPGAWREACPGGSSAIDWQVAG